VVSKAPSLKLKIAYVTDLRKSGYVVSTEMLKLEASKIAQKFNIPVTEFKANYRWI
jgi:hypothetical protein